MRLLDSGAAEGTPGWDNRVKGLVRRLLPARIWGYLARNHMKHDSLGQRR